MTGTLVVSDHRLVRDPGLQCTSNGPAFRAMLTPMLAHVFVPLPAEPVGVGATWDVPDIDPAISFMRWCAEPPVVHYELLSRSGDRVTLRFTVSGEMADAKSLEGSTVSVTADTFSGDGSINLDLMQLAPLTLRRRDSLRSVVDSTSSDGTRTRSDGTLALETRVDSQ
jgi:hypothetical protein